jgi:hypothetical protein
MAGDWQKLLVTLEANIAEIPQLEPFRAKLSGMLTQALDVTKRQADLKASKQAASKREAGHLPVRRSAVSGYELL